MTEEVALWSGIAVFVGSTVVLRFLFFSLLKAILICSTLGVLVGLGINERK